MRRIVDSSTINFHIDQRNIYRPDCNRGEDEAWLFFVVYELMKVTERRFRYLNSAETVSRAVVS